MRHDQGRGEERRQHVAVRVHPVVLIGHDEPPKKALVSSAGNHVRQSRWRRGRNDSPGSSPHLATQLSHAHGAPSGARGGAAGARLRDHEVSEVEARRQQPSSERRPAAWRTAGSAANGHNRSVADPTMVSGRDHQNLGKARTSPRPLWTGTPRPRDCRGVLTSRGAQRHPTRRSACAMPRPRGRGRPQPP